MDDNLTGFYKLRDISHEEAKKQTIETCTDISKRNVAAKRSKERVSGDAMFYRAMMEVQSHPLVTGNTSVLAGYLRDDGTCVCKRWEWSTQSLSLYKIVLVNLQRLKQLQIAYKPELRAFEDISIATEVVDAGSMVLKCQSYVYRATSMKSGGCEQDRKAIRAGKMSILHDHAAVPFDALPRCVKNIFSWADAHLQKLG